MPRISRPTVRLEVPIHDLIGFQYSLQTEVYTYKGRVIAQVVSRWFPARRPGLHPRSNHVGFVEDKVALGKVFS
jgi:hypothetical protein